MNIRKKVLLSYAFYFIVVLVALFVLLKIDDYMKVKITFWGDASSADYATLNIDEQP